jgi:hypothetical protein
MYKQSYKTIWFHCPNVLTCCLICSLKIDFEVFFARYKHDLLLKHFWSEHHCFAKYLMKLQSSSGFVFLQTK